MFWVPLSSGCVLYKAGADGRENLGTPWVFIVNEEVDAFRRLDVYQSRTSGWINCAQCCTNSTNKNWTKARFDA